MLSLLSLIIASGTVLRADTELWEPLTYPDPRTNATECHIADTGTLCDPDHILTDTWRQTIYDNLKQHMLKLQLADVKYTKEAEAECRMNDTEGVQIFVILARRINTANNNQSITSNDLTSFGHGLRDAYGLDKMTCKNYVLILGVELSKQIYVWTGSDLAVPALENNFDQMEKYRNLFNERNYVEGLSQIIDEIAAHIINQPETTTMEVTEDASEITSTTPLTANSHNSQNNSNIPLWVYIVMSVSIIVAAIFAIAFAILFYRSKHRSDVHEFPANLPNGNFEAQKEPKDNEEMNNFEPMKKIIIRRLSDSDGENFSTNTTEEQTTEYQASEPEPVIARRNSLITRFEERQFDDEQQRFASF